MEVKKLPSVSSIRKLFKYNDLGYLEWVIPSHPNSTSIKYNAAAGSINPSTGRRSIMINQELYLASRLIYMYHMRKDPGPKAVIDHISGDHTDDRIENLRAISNSQNRLNTQVSPGSLSGYRGVYWSKHSSKWRAELKYQGQRYSLGSHAVLEDAVAARKAAEKRLGVDSYIRDPLESESQNPA